MSGYEAFDESGILDDRYVLRRHLGAGSSSDVMEAFDNKTQTSCAIKKISGALQPKRVLREIHIMKRLSHQNIIRLIDVRCVDFSTSRAQSRSDNSIISIYLVLEYLDTDLRKLINSPQFLTKEHVQSILSQILHGLMYIHSANVIHRDLKPDNILITENCTVKICDFGLARVINNMNSDSVETREGSDSKVLCSQNGSTPNHIIRSVSTHHLLEPHVGYHKKPKRTKLNSNASDNHDLIVRHKMVSGLDNVFEDVNDHEAKGWNQCGNSKPPVSFSMGTLHQRCNIGDIPLPSPQMRGQPTYSGARNNKEISFSAEAALHLIKGAVGRLQVRKRSLSESEYGSESHISDGAGSTTDTSTGLHSYSVTEGTISTLSGGETTESSGGDGSPADNDDQEHDDRVASPVTPTSIIPATAATIHYHQQRRVHQEEEETHAPSRRGYPLRRTMTMHVVTRWYRAPELILMQNYSFAVDIWSVGCIFAELLGCVRPSTSTASYETAYDVRSGPMSAFMERKALFPGSSCFPLSPKGGPNDNEYRQNLRDGVLLRARTDPILPEKWNSHAFESDSHLRDQLDVILDIIGGPDEDDIQSIPDPVIQDYLRSLTPKRPKRLSSLYPAADDYAVDLLKKMLIFNPHKRISCQDILKHPFFYSGNDCDMSEGELGTHRRGVCGTVAKEAINHRRRDNIARFEPALRTTGHENFEENICLSTLSSRDGVYKKHISQAPLMLSEDEAGSGEDLMKLVMQEIADFNS